MTNAESAVRYRHRKAQLEAVRAELRRLLISQFDPRWTKETIPSSVVVEVLGRLAALAGVDET